MKRFLIRLAAFSSLIFVFVGPAFVFLSLSGELASFKDMIRRSQYEGALIGLAYSNPIHHLKSQIVIEREPEVVVLGTSRTMQIRSFFFKEEKKFYNCGGSVHKVGDMVPFLESISGQVPEIIILGLDQNFFNEGWDDLIGGTLVYRSSNKSPLQLLSIASRDFYKDVLRKNLDLRSFSFSDAKEKIGLTAIVHNEGYREDGSYKYRESVRISSGEHRENFSRAIEIIQGGGGDGRFMFSKNISSEAVNRLDDFLGQCKSQNIHVIGFLPPYAGAVFTEMKKVEENYPYVFLLGGEVEPLFSKYGFKVYDFGDLASSEATDLEMQDAIHGYDKVLLKIMLKISASESRLRSKLAVSAMESLLRNSPGHFLSVEG